LQDYHKEELQLLLLAVEPQWYKSEPNSQNEKVLKAWVYRIRQALKDK
jgi:hypothetical protein